MNSVRWSFLQDDREDRRTSFHKAQYLQPVLVLFWTVIPNNITVVHTWKNVWFEVEDKQRRDQYSALLTFSHRNLKEVSCSILHPHSWMVRIGGEILDLGERMSFYFKDIHVSAWSRQNLSVVAGLTWFFASPEPLIPKGSWRVVGIGYPEQNLDKVFAWLL